MIDCAGRCRNIKHSHALTLCFQLSCSNIYLQFHVGSGDMSILSCFSRMTSWEWESVDCLATAASMFSRRKDRIWGRKDSLTSLSLKKTRSMWKSIYPLILNWTIKILIATSTWAMLSSISPNRKQQTHRPTHSHPLSKPNITVVHATLSNKLKNATLVHTLCTRKIFNHGRMLTWLQVRNYSRMNKISWEISAKCAKICKLWSRAKSDCLLITGLG